MSRRTLSFATIGGALLGAVLAWALTEFEADAPDERLQRRIEQIGGVRP